MGFDGVQNFPTVGLIDGVLRQNLEETGMGYGLEVDMIREAHKLDLLTCPYVFDADSAREMARAGADVLVAHLGLTTKGSIGAKTALTLDESAARVQAMHDAARAVRKDVFVICHGGPIAEPEDVALRARAHDRCRRLLRRVEHRALRDRGRHRGTGAAVPHAGAARQGPLHPQDNEEDRPCATLTPAIDEDWHARHHLGSA